MSITILKLTPQVGTGPAIAQSPQSEIYNIAEKYFGNGSGEPHFELSADFLKKFKGKKPKFGFNGLGEFVFYRTYSRLKKDGSKETFLDVLKRVVEGCYEIQRRHCNHFHIPWDYDKAQGSAQEMFQRMWDFKFLPPGRGLWMMGTKFMWERGSAALNNCLEFNTRVITRDGIKPIGELAGTTQTLMTSNGEWVDAPVRSFGTQKLMKIVLKRFRTRKVIYATPEHRWFARPALNRVPVSVGRDERLRHIKRKGPFQETFTRDLEAGFELQMVYGQGVQSIRPSQFGIAHGICFGDGTLGHKDQGTGSYLYLCGKKNFELLKFFSESSTSFDPRKGVEGAIRVADLPRHYKSPPDLRECKTYLYGWLAGYFAADGSINKKACTAFIHSSKQENMELVREVCAILGIGTGLVQQGMQVVNHRGDRREFIGYRVYLKLEHLTEEFFLLSHHRQRFLDWKERGGSHREKWVVESVEGTDREEEVYCATVPGKGCFVLEDNILTGNCGFVSTSDLSEADPAEPFCFLMDMSMLGVGVGFDTKGAGRINIYQPNPNIIRPFVIPDSREGWVDSVRHLIRSYTVTCKEGIVEFDYSNIREAESEIKGFGGKSSGPGILMELHVLIRAHLDSKVGQTLDSVDITDLMNYIGRCVVAGNVRRCKPYYSMVQLERGLVQMKDVLIGDRVLTADGYCEVSEVVHQGKQEIIEIHHQMGIFECTSKHRMAVLVNDKEYIWKRAEDLLPADRLVFIPHTSPGVHTTLPIHDHIQSPMNHTGIGITIPDLDVDIAWFLGALHGDGYVRANRKQNGYNAHVMFPVNSDEYHDGIVAKLNAAFTKFGVLARPMPSQDNSKRYRVINKQLAWYLDSNFKQPKTTIKVPKCVLEGTPEVRGAYLAGVLDTDGSVKHGKVTRISLVCSVYRRFIDELQAVYASLGIPTRIRISKTGKKNPNVRYQLRLVGRFARRRFAKLVMPYAIKKVREVVLATTATGNPKLNYSYPVPRRVVAGCYVEYGRNNASVDIGAEVKYVPVAVKSIVRPGRVEDTYDLSVKGRHELIADCLLTHNTAEIAFGDADDEAYCSMKNATKTLLPEDVPVWYEVTNKIYAAKRSSASLADFDGKGIPEDRLMPAIKTWNALNHHRWASNNSIFAKVGMNYDSVGHQIGVNGEPGIIWLDNVRDYGRMADGLKPGVDGRVMGANPCMEQSLESYELCVSGNTKLQLRDSVHEISDVVGKSVEVWNGDGWSTVTPRITGYNRELYRVHLSDGSYLDTTDNHGWSVRPAGKRIYRRVETQGLQLGDRVQGFSLGKIDGQHEPHAFEMGYATGDGYIDQGGRYAMAVACGPKAELKELAMSGRWYKPQIKEGYTDPYHRINLTEYVSASQVIQLRDKSVGLPEWVMAFNRNSILQFIAGWIEADGCVCKQANTHGYRIYGLEAKIRDAQLLLRRIGINHASVNFCHPAGQVTNKGVRENDLWYIQIPSFECSEIPTRVKRAVKIGSRIRPNPRYPNRGIDMAKKQYVERVEKLDDFHTTYCFDEPDNHMGVFGNAITYQCNLVETFPSNHDDADDYMRTLKFAYLYAKTVTLLSTHNRRTNQVTLRNRRIGLSQSGIVEAIAKFGRRRLLKDFCDAGYNEVRRWDQIYSEWMCVPKSIKVTSVKPSGTVSLVVGVSPGIHHPEAGTYWRTVRVAKNSILIKILREAGFKIEPSVTDSDHTMVVYFGVTGDSGVRPVGEVNIWEQMQNVIDYQRYWADNQVSCTVKFKPSEKSDIPRVLEAFEDQLKGISFLPHEDHGYAQAPYIPCAPSEVEEYNKRLGNTDYSEYLYEAVGSNFCDNDKCVLPSA